MALNINKDLLSEINLLYAEDDDEIREQLSILLSKFIKNIYQAKNGKEALEIFTNNKIDIVITDIQMPLMNGLELLSKIRAIDTNVHTIVTTAYSDSLYLLKSIDVGVDAYIIKPLDPKKVLETIAKYAKIVAEQKELKKYRENLEAKIQEEIEKSTKKDEILQKQSLQASMGEMINSIAHQWRQPLNAINVEATNIIVGLDLDEDKAIIKSYASNVINLTKKMSKIITDFMEFNNPNRTIKELKIAEILQTTKDVLLPQLSKGNIKLDIIVENDIAITTSISALKEVLVNLINNARDALVEKNQEKDRFIKIFTKNSDTMVTIFIEDNAGGIPQEIVEKIFNPYFTTKPKGVGTGIGLSIVKNLLEKQLNGSIEFENTSRGALFKVTIPIKAK